MSLEKAKSYYADRTGTARLNCGQAIIAAFKEKFSLAENSVSLFTAYGGGRAPGGDCGAYYAAKFMLKEKYQEKIRECENVFLSNAGSTKCKEVRQLKRLPCAGCVEKIAEFIEKI